MKRTLPKGKFCLAIALLLIALLLPIGLAYSSSENYTAITTITGSKDQTTSYFTVPTNEWRISWTCNPNRTFSYGLFAVSIYPQGESTPLVDKIAAMGNDDTSGVLYIHEGGKSYSLKITAVHYIEYQITIEYAPSTRPTLPTLTPTPTPSPTPTLSPSTTLTPTPSPALTPSPSPSVPEFPAWVALPLLVAFAATAAYLAKSKKKT
jgi:hypothetical protein